MCVFSFVLFCCFLCVFVLGDGRGEGGGRGLVSMQCVQQGNFLITLSIESFG